MTIQKTIAALKKTIPQHAAAFDTSKRRNQIFADYGTAAELATVLDAVSKLGADERRTLTLALVGAAQTSRSPLFQALLLIAYEPFLISRAAARKRDEDAEQNVLCEFLEAIQIPIEWMRVAHEDPLAA